MLVNFVPHQSPEEGMKHNQLLLPTTQEGTFCHQQVLVPLTETQTGSDHMNTIDAARRRDAQSGRFMDLAEKNRNSEFKLISTLINVRQTCCV